MILPQLGTAMRRYSVDLLSQVDTCGVDSNTPRLTVVPVHFKTAQVIFLLSEGANPSIRALFLREGGQFEMKYLGFTVNGYIARVEKWHQKQSEKRAKFMEEQDKLNYDSEEELSD